MKRQFPRIASLSALAVGVMLGGAGRAAAQNNSLYATEQQRAAITPADHLHARRSRGSMTQPQPRAFDPGRHSWTYQTPVDVKKIAQLNDIVKVTVSVKSSMTSQGKIDRKKQGFSD